MARRVHVLLAATAAALSATSAFGQIVFDPNAVSGNVNGANGTVGVVELRSTSNLGSQDDARTALLDNSQTNRTAAQFGTINFYGNAADGHFLNNVNFQQGNGNQIALLARGSFNVPTAGNYTFIVNSDDGFTLAIDGGAAAWSGAFSSYNPAAPAEVTNALGPYNTITPTYNTTHPNGALQFYGGRGSADTGGVVNLSAGVHTLDMTFHQGGGGTQVELMAAAGAKGGFDSSFRLVGSQFIPGNAGVNKLPTVGPFTLKEYDSAAAGNTNLGEIIQSGQQNTNVGNARLRSTTSQQTIHFTDSQDQNNGSHGGDAAVFPGDHAGVGDDNYGAYATATLTVAPGDVGRYTFAMYTDDDSRFRILNSSNTPIPLVGQTVGNTYDSDNANGADQFGTDGCCSDFIGHYDLTAGTYTIESAFHEGGGGSGFFLYGTMGETNTFDASRFQLIGAGTTGAAWQEAGTSASELQWVTPVPEPTSLALLSLGGFGLLARRRKA